jgi:leucyl aminopeptidase
MNMNLRLNGYTEEQVNAANQDAISRLHKFTGSLGTWFTNKTNDFIDINLGLGPKDARGPNSIKVALSALSTLNLDELILDITSIIDELETDTKKDEMTRLVATEILDKNPTTRLILHGRPLPKSLMIQALAVCRGNELARKVTNASGTDMNPVQFATLATQISERHGLEINIFEGPELLNQNYPAIHAMGAGSKFPAHFIEMSYSADSDSPPIVLVGKGVTFDTGGLSLKTPEAMAGMRHDICGAATVLGIMSVLKEIDCKLNVIGLFPVIENMIGPNSIRPGDSIPTRKGTPIRVLDTDFEGRVILADALTRANELNPRLVIDFSTLTYQSIIALGPEIGAFFCTSETEASRFKTAADSVGELFWQLPLASIYRTQILTESGLKNHPETGTARAITAALFLQEFSSAVVPWIHIDATGPTWKGTAGQDGATGFGVSTLIELLLHMGIAKQR